LARREARGEDRAIKEGKADSILQTKSWPYQSIQQSSCNVQQAFRNTRQRDKAAINFSNISKTPKIHQ
jgi:hypothetical protein